jgi:hypothetical protein
LAETEALQTQAAQFILHPLMVADSAYSAGSNILTVPLKDAPVLCILCWQAGCLRYFSVFACGFPGLVLLLNLNLASCFNLLMVFGDAV